MTDGKDDFEKVLINVIGSGRLKPLNSPAIRSMHINLSILTLHQVAEVILNLAIPITSLTSNPDKYCELWHKEIGNDIDGIKAMLAILENAYQKVDTTLQANKKL